MYTAVDYLKTKIVGYGYALIVAYRIATLFKISNTNTLRSSTVC